MKVSIEDGNIVLEEVFSGILLRTPEGNEIGICMRDGTFEINVIGDGSDNWHTVDYNDLTILKYPIKNNPSSQETNEEHF